MNAKKIEQFRLAFGAALRARRLKSGLSQEDFAVLAGVHRTYVGDVERGVKNVCLGNLAKMSVALKAPLSELMLEMERNLGR